MLHEENKQKQLIKSASFLVYKAFEGYSYLNIKFPLDFSWEELEMLQFVSGGIKLVCYGPIGIRKTRMAIVVDVKA